MNRSLIAIGVALVVGLAACGGDDSPTTPVGSERGRLHVTGEWPRAREATFENATWKVWWFRDYPSGVICMGSPCGEFETIADGPIDRDGHFVGFSPEVECRDYRISLSGTYAQNREPCTASSKAVACISEEQHFSGWGELEFGSCVDGGEEPIPTFHLDLAVNWDMSQDDGFNPGDWNLHQWSVDDIRWHELDSGSIPSTGQFRVQTLVSCPDDTWWTGDGKLKVELSGRYPVGPPCTIPPRSVECSDAPQEEEFRPPSDLCT